MLIYHKGRSSFFILTLLIGFSTRCSGKVVFEKELRRQPSTGSILIEIAKELMDRPKNTNQVLNLNLSNFLLLFILKAVVFGANYIGNNEFNKGRSLDTENIVSEEEISLALGYLIGDKCLYRAACEVPNTAKDYLDAVDILVQTLKLIPQTASMNKTYEKSLAEFRKAIEYGTLKQCPSEYNCKQENINNFFNSVKLSLD